MASARKQVIFQLKLSDNTDRLGLTLTTNGLVRHLNAAIKHHFLDISVTQRNGVVGSDPVADNFDRKAVIVVADAHSLTLTDAYKGYPNSGSSQLLMI